MTATRTLNNLVQMPLLGIGVRRIPPREATRLTVRWALAAGYRRIDVAYSYGNERDVGEVLGKSGLPRSELFVVNKLWNADHGYDSALHAFDHSLNEMKLDYFDLYLIQWPMPGRRDESWRALQRILADGRVRAIGVCNYTVRHLEQLLNWADVVPAVNQVEFSPFLYQRDLLHYCEDHGIQLDASTPLTRKKRLDDPRLLTLAGRTGHTPAELLLRWAIQHGLVTSFTSIHQGHIRRNMRVFDFELRADDMAELDAFDEGYRVEPDPNLVE